MSPCERVKSLPRPRLRPGQGKAGRACTAGLCRPAGPHSRTREQAAGHKQAVRAAHAHERMGHRWVLSLGR
jgi:hypothetical protein